MRAIVAGRLFGARWPLAALAACLLVAWGFGWLPAAIAALMFAVVFATAALAPRRATRKIEPDRQGENGEGLAQISAADLASAVSDAIIIFDGEGAALHANEAAVAAFGPFAAGFPLQRRFRAPEMQQLIENMLSGAMGSSVVEYVERVPIERVFRVTATRIQANGALFVVVFKDQSETRRIDRMRADFIANASHELRTPLASITGFVEALRGPARNDAAARESFLKIMQEQTGRMARLIDDLLSLSRLEMKPFLPAGIEVDIRETIDSVIDSLGPLAREAGVEVCASFQKARSSSPAAATSCSRYSRICWRTPANMASRAARWSFRSRPKLPPKARPASPSATSGRASRPSTFRASPSASTAPTSTPAAAARAPALASPS